MTAETPLVRGHRLTPSFTDSAIDVELTEEYAHENGDEDVIATTAPSKVNSDTLNERIVHIAQLVANNDALRGLSQDDCAAVNAYLDNIEEIINLRRDNSPNVAPNRPASSTGNATPTTKSPLAIADSRRKPIPKATTPSQSQTVSRDLTSILQEVTTVNSELRQRYLESRHIHDVFIVKCEGLAQRIIELEEEVHELKSDILEDTIELEGLRGTVRGLDSWVNRWQRQRESSLPSHKSDIRKSKGRSYWRRKSKYFASNEEEEDDGNDFDTFLDGVLAWMRGWNDVEEGFLIRARRRKLRRNRKELGLLDTQAL